MITINATVLAAGDEGQFGGFFTAGWEYLASQLDAIGITAQNGDILNTDVAHCMTVLSEATRSSELIIILTAPQPHTATLVAALLAKGLGLKLQISPKAREYVQLHSQRVANPLSQEDEEAYCTIPAGAVTLQNPLGYLQGYAITARRQLLMVLPAAPSELQGSYSSYVGELVSRFADSAAQQQVTVPDDAVQSSGIAPQPVHTHSIDPAPRSQADTVSDVCRALDDAGLTIATAESGTSGALAQTLGSCQSVCLSPADSFVGREALESLEIPSDLLATHGAVSPQAAAALALAARSRAATSLGVAVTCTSAKSQGKQAACIAVTDGKKVWGKTCTGDNGNNHQLKLGAVLEALGILNLYAHGSGLPEGISAASAVTAAGGAAVQSTGLAARSGGKLSGMLARFTSKPANEGSEDNTMARTNLLQRLRRGKLTKNDKIRLGAVAVFICIFIGCIVYIGTVFGESANNLKMTDDLKTLFNDSSDVPESVKEVYPKAYQTKFAQLYAQNADVAGWIKIDDTKVDYPVVQTADNLFYERKDFTRASNQHGIPFIDFRVDNRAPSTNTVIYAHNMNDGQMFGELLNYKSLNYYKEHPIVQYDSVYRDGDYKIFGIVLCKKDDPDFNYHNYIDKDSDADMTEYVTKIRERSLINTGVDVRTSDELLTLSTCDYDFKSATGERIARFVIFARRVREGESLEVDTSKATINTNPTMPKEWYDTLAKQQAAEIKKQEEVQAATVNKKWLTDSEQTSLSAEEQKTVAANREADALKYLTEDELSYMELDEKIYTIRNRKQEFTLFLTTSEQSSMSLSKRITLAQERADLAAEYLDEDEIKTAGKWSRIEALIKERQKAASTTVADEAKWLTAEEIKTLSVNDKKDIIAQRRSEAKDAGVTDAEIASTKTWAAMQKLIESKKPTTTTPEQYIKQNPLWLDDRDLGLSVEELKQIMANRKQSATDAGVSPSKYNKWADLEAAIDKANSGKNEAAKITELVKNNPAWLSSSDASGNTLAQLQDLLASRHKMATDAGLDPATMTTKTWSETKAAIDKASSSNSEAAKITELVKNNPAWLSSADAGGKTLAQVQELLASRKKMATDAGLDPAAMTTKSWSETKAAIDKASSSNSEAAKITELVKGNPAWLSSSDAGGKTLAQMQELLASRQKMATDVGLDPGAMTTKSWSETKAAIDKKKAENEQNASAKEKERQAYISSNLAFLNSDDKAKTLDELVKLVGDRAAKANGVDVSSSTSWTQTQKLIEAAKKPVVPPADGGSSSGGGSSTGGGGSSETPPAESSEPPPPPPAESSENPPPPPAESSQNPPPPPPPPANTENTTPPPAAPTDNTQPAA